MRPTQNYSYLHRGSFNSELQNGPHLKIFDPNPSSNQTELQKKYLFAAPKRNLSWTKPQYDRAYKQFLERRYQEIDSLQKGLKQNITSAMIKELETDESKRKDFLNDIQSYIVTIEDLFKLIVEKDGKFKLKSLNHILDTKKIPAFSSLVFRSEHNTRNPLNTMNMNLQIFKSYPLMFKEEMLGPLVRSLQSSFEQIDSLFDTLRNPSHQANLREFDIDEYLYKLEKEYQKMATDNDIQLNWTVNRSSNVDFETFTNDPEKIQTEILNNLIENSIQHLKANPDLPHEINVQVSLAKQGRPENTIKFIVSNPSKITDEQFARLTQFKMGFSTKTDKSKSHGIALVTAKDLCESALGGEFEITRDLKTNYFTTTLTLKDLGSKTKMKAAA